jgi:hypothetical protein
VLGTNRNGNVRLEGENHRVPYPSRHGSAMLLGSLVLLLASVSCSPGWDLAVAVLKRSRSIPSNVIQTGTLGAPSHLTVVFQGNGFVLSWASGSNGDGYEILGAEQLSPDCARASFAAVGTANGLSATHFIDAKRKLGEGHWFCYQVRTRRGTWTSGSNNPIVAAKRSEGKDVTPVAMGPVAMGPVAKPTITSITTRVLAFTPAPTAAQSFVVSATLPAVRRLSPAVVGTRNVTVAVTPIHTVTATIRATRAVLVTPAVVSIVTATPMSIRKVVTTTLPSTFTATRPTR